METIMRAGMVAASDSYQSNSNFGRTGALVSEGDTIVVGAPFDRQKGHNAGAFYVFEKTETGYEERAKVYAPDAHSWTQLGWAASLDGDRLAVGAPGAGADNVINGAVYIYERQGGTWNLQATITPPDGDALYTSFGSGVALDGDSLLIGRSGDNSYGGQSGKAYVYGRNGGAWELQHTLVPDTPKSLSFFGNNVILAGDTAVIAAFQENTTAANDSGAVYVFKKGGDSWAQTQRLTPPHTVPCNFGERIVMSGDTLVVGAPQTNGYTGAAHVYVRDATGAFASQAQLESPEEIAHAGNSQYGIAVALSGDALVVGAPQTTDKRNKRVGGAWIYTRANGTWTIQASLDMDENARNGGGGLDLEGELVVSAATSENGDAFLFGYSADRFIPQLPVGAPPLQAIASAEHGGTGGARLWGIDTSGALHSSGRDGAWEGPNWQGAPSNLVAVAAAQQEDGRLAVWVVDEANQLHGTSEEVVGGAWESWRALTNEQPQVQPPPPLDLTKPVTIESAAFPGVYLSINAAGVDYPLPPGGGQVQCCYGTSDQTEFKLVDNGDGTYGIESVKWPGRFMRMCFHTDGALYGHLNVQFGAASCEGYKLVDNDDGTYSIESAHPSGGGQFLRMDGSNCTAPGTCGPATFGPGSDPQGRVKLANVAS